MKIVFLFLLLPSLAFAYDCQVRGTVQDCRYNLDWTWTGDPTKADGFLSQLQGPNNTWADLAKYPISARHAEHVFVGDPGNVEQCVRMFAFNSSGMSDPSNTACITTPVIDVVTMKTAAIVTTSHRATDTSSIIAILVNASTVIGAGGLELTYPAKYTLTVSRRAGDKSSVISILVNKSTSVIINP